MLNKDLETTLNGAFRDARQRRHEFMTVEHLLLALLDNPAAAEALVACGANLDRLRTEINAYIEETTPLIPEEDTERETQPTNQNSGEQPPLVNVLKCEQHSVSYPIPFAENATHSWQ